jgi:hypothetical protein
VFLLNRELSSSSINSHINVTAVECSLSLASVPRIKSTVDGKVTGCNIGKGCNACRVSGAIVSRSEHRNDLRPS